MGAIFLVGGALHYSVGTWQLSKKLAQRDAAERAVGFFVGHWSDMLLSNDLLTDSAHALDRGNVVLSNDNETINCSIPEVWVLECFSRHFRKHDDTYRWHETYVGNRWQAYVEMDISGVPHKFAGPQCSDRVDAYRQ